MAQEPMPWDMDWAQPQPSAAPASNGYVVRRADPNAGLDAQYRAGQVAGQRLDAANAPYDAAKARADARKAEAEAIKAERELAKGAAGKGSDKARTELSRMIERIDGISADAGDNGGWGETGLTGSMLREWSGSPAFDLAGGLKTLDATAAFTALSEMRANSPTGAALGAVSDTELGLLKSTIANLDPNQSQERFQEALGQTRRAYSDMLEKLPPAPGAEQAPVPSFVPALPASIGSDRMDRSATLALTPLSAPPMDIATGATKTVDDPTLRGVNANVEKLIRSGKGKGAIVSYLQAVGINPAEVPGIDAALAFRAKNPAYRGRYSVNLDDKTVDMSWLQRKLSNNADTAAGAYVTGAANAATFGGLDEIAGALGGNVEQVNAAKQAIRRNHPYADMAGNVAGGIATSFGGARALSGLGMLGSRAVGTFAPRLLASNAASGAAYGAGERNDDRLGGAAMGAAAGAVGGVLGRGGANAIGRAIAPTGGRLAPLYEAGVRPTLGQRLAGTGFVGNTIAKAEEAMQSIPLLGSAVSGARSEAREQFERGAFNSALKEIDQALPAGAAVGREAHAFTQKAFDDVYDQARSGMTFAVDQQFRRDLGAFGRNLNSGVLSREQAERVQAILQNTVGSRLRGGAMQGDAYKVAAAEIGKASRQLGASDPMMAKALRDYGAIFDASARRNSSPNAVSLMDKADAGYAKLVRVEQAASRVGGETGRFTPAQFDRAVQTASGGVRSRSYLRGDALMGEYALAGRQLMDTLPNSGTVDRGLMAGGLAGVGFVEPSAAATAALATLPYLPGLRRGTGALLAPRSSASLNQAGRFIKGKKRISGMLGAPLTVQYATVE